MSGDPDGFLLATGEREQVLQALGAHFEAGRLSLDQYDQRVAAAVAADTRGQLRPLFADLPSPYPPFMTWPGGGGPRYQPPSLHSPLVVQSDKSQYTAGLLQLLVPMGAGRFYVGHNAIGACQAVCALVALMFLAANQVTFALALLAWCWIDAIILLTSGGTDSYDRRLRR